jgi:hypothetical protein
MKNTTRESLDTFTSRQKHIDGVPPGDVRANSFWLYSNRVEESDIRSVFNRS